MILTAGQERALDMVRRLKDSEGVVVAGIGGYAGTGKTTLLKVVAEEIGAPVIIAPTGKAAARVHEATGLGAMTIHRWMFETIEGEDGRLTFRGKERGAIPKGEAGIVVIDEASMVGSELWDAVLETARSLQLKVLCIGDPFQLPPVEEDKRAAPFSLLNPQNGILSDFVLLDEVLRQAQDSPVIRASMALRAGDVMGALRELPKVKKENFIDEAARVQAHGGVIICHANRTRHWANEGIRRGRHLPEADIAPGEPILVLRNSYNLQVFNGETHRFRRWMQSPMGKHTVYDRHQKLREETKLGWASLETDDGQDFGAVILVEELFGRLKSSFRAMDETADISYPEYPIIHANFGYTMTAHKSQGSEWPEVLIAWEPSLKFWGDRKEEGLRWAYTSVTRAQEKCSIAMGVTAPKA